MDVAQNPAPPIADTFDRRFGVTATLAGLRRDQLWRERIALESAQGPCVRIEGRAYLNFCSNDYLALAAHPQVSSALAEAARQYGAGAGASPLVCGRSLPHAALETELAAWLRRDRALLFSSGYLANLAVATAFISGRGALIAEDRRNHASLLDGALLSRARLRRYRHGDPAALAALLRGPETQKLVLTDSVFSMDGDIAPLRELAEACRTAAALLAVDDAHGLGVLGESGAGALEAAGLGQAEVPLLVGTFGKALGTAGAFIAGPEPLIELLVQRARSYIYSTAQPPALAAATLAALHVLRAEPARRRVLQQNIARFRQRAQAAGIALARSDTPIQPLILGTAARALAAAATLRARGILVQAIRPPTVPRGGARLRITLSSGHDGGQIDRLVDALAEITPA